MLHPLPRRHAAALLVVGCLPLLPGCIVGEIRDELVAVNQGLAGVNGSLGGVNDNLDRVNERLAAVDTRLGEIDQQLTAIDGELVTLSPKLEPLPNLERLQTLASITQSLEQVDAHLAALRRTISSLDSAVPFLKFSDKEDEEAAGAPAANPPASGSGAGRGAGGGG